MTFNAEAYHCGQAEELGYITMDPIQFFFSDAVIKAAGGALKGNKAADGVKVAEGVAKVKLAFNRGVLENFSKHAFTGGRHADLGLSVETMASKGLNLIEQNMHLLKVGDNTLIGNINGIQKTFKAFVKDGKIMSVNMYPRVTNRVTHGAVINFGNVVW
ncbi:MAG: hypothetical protein ACYC2U_07110 [Candidatus Amoebophilus sp.]